MHLANLNRAQLDAVQEPITSQLQILAGPGTGKTKTLTSRIASLLQNGAKPEELVVMTFTNHAAREMKQRVMSIVPDHSLLTGLQIGTFHSICFLYLKKYGNRIGLSPKLSICAEQDKAAILKEILRKQEFIDASAVAGFVRMAEDRYYKVGGDTFKVYLSTVGTIISGIKDGVSKREDANDLYEFTEVMYKFYCNELAEDGKVDFDDILNVCGQLLEQHPQIVERVKHVLIDEFQDSNKVQLKLAKLFAQKCQSITVVGDPDQSIYAFRHARPENLVKMLEYFPDTKTIYLEENYRSTQSILDIATKLIQLDKNRLGADRRLIGYTKFNYRVPVIAFRNPQAEANAVAQNIVKTIQESNGLFTYKDFAVLCRTNKYMKEMEMNFNLLGIPYKTLGGFKYWERQEISLLIDYLRVVNTDDERLAISRTLTTPKRGIGQGSLDKIFVRPVEGTTYLGQLRAISEDTKIAKKFGVGNAIKKKLKAYIDFIDECRALYEEKGPQNIESLLAVVDLILTKQNLLDVLSTDSTNRRAREHNVEAFKEFIANLDSSLDNSLAIDSQEPDDTLDFLLSSISLDTKSEGKHGNVATISTIHSAKGLEWPVVFMVNATDRSSYRMSEKEQNEIGRTLFVAITRAKALLYISYPLDTGTYGGEYGCLASHLNEDTVYKHFDVRKSLPALKKKEFQAIAEFLKRSYDPNGGPSLESGEADSVPTGFRPASSLIFSKKTKSAKKDAEVQQVELEQPVEMSHAIAQGTPYAATRPLNHPVPVHKPLHATVNQDPGAKRPRNENKSNLASLQSHSKFKFVSRPGHNAASAFKRPRPLESTER